MATQKIALTSAPVQVSNGSKQAFVQSVNGKQFKLIESATLPTDLTKFGLFSSANIGEGFSMWAVNDSGSSIDIVVMTPSA